MASAPVEVAEELLVVIGCDGLALRPRLGTAAYDGARDPAALDDPDQAVGRHGEQHHHEQDLEHETKRRGSVVSPYAGAVKEFVVYTGLRLLMFAATFGVIIGVWLLVADRANIFVAVVAAFIVSGLGSYFLLNGQREAFAQRVEARAARAAKAFDERKAKEDVD
jgi:hypothetical protein